jgi:hypothetical protein
LPVVVLEVQARGLAVEAPAKFLLTQVMQLVLRHLLVLLWVQVVQRELLHSIQLQIDRIQELIHPLESSLQKAAAPVLHMRTVHQR